MSSVSPRPRPSLLVPAALVSFWPAAGADDAEARRTAAAYASQTGVERVGERLFAILPRPARENVFDDAIALGQAVFGHLRKSGADQQVAGVLIFPGEVEVTAGAVRLVDEELLRDFSEREPRFKARGLFFTGYAASWLRGRFQFDSVGLYDGPSGRRVPIHRLVGEAPELGPWHNPEILGRQIMIPRPEVREGLEAASSGVLRVQGPLGSGKSHAVWHYLLDQEGPKLWFRVARSLFGKASLARRLVVELHKLAPESLPPGGDELRHPEALAPVHAADLLSVWLDNACLQLGATLWIVCDLVQSAVEADLDLLANLLVRRGSVFRMLLISRSGGPMISQLADLPRVDVLPMEESELTELGQQIFAGLSMPTEVEKRFLEASAGFPFALEEGLTDLVHRTFVRRVYGSFFYGGGADVGYEPSRRLVRYVAAEVPRLGEALPLRILAAAGQPVPALHLETACGQFGLGLPPGWLHALTSAGWLRESPSAWGPGLSFACPAYGQALLDTVSADSVEVLRQALGQSMASAASPQEVTWQTYQLLAGSADALPSLLHLSKKADTPAARLEIFEALEREYRLHVSRRGDPQTELELLWKLLPLGHRLGKLSELEAELARATELAVGEPARYAALALVRAEHDQEQGRRREALRGVESALMATEGGPAERRALIAIQLGKLLLRQEQTTKARKLFTELLVLVNENGPTVLGANCHFHLGEIALWEGRLKRAAKHHGMALEIRRRHGQPRPISASLSAHGALALSEGNYPGARDSYREAREVLGDESESELSESLIGLGRALGHLGDAAAATRHLRRALELRQGRGDVAAEQVARLHLAENFLDLGQLDQALKEAHRAHFKLSLLPASTYLADAEQLVGRILVQFSPPGGTPQANQLDKAGDRFQEALRLHLERQQTAAAALDSSWLLRVALEKGDESAILRQSQELDALFEGVRHPIHGELVLYRLFRAFLWLRERGTSSREPVAYLRRAHQELMWKLGFLEPKMRHQFLFNVRHHQEILNVAVEYDLSLPSFSAQAIVKVKT
jgi:tetratricopeptide (TPR) repeat protein